MTPMRAKMAVRSVEAHREKNVVTQEIVTMSAVFASKYPEDGSDEDNTYARFTPTASLSITIRNPDLLGKYEVGQTFYVDFTPAQAKDPAPVTGV